MISPFSKSETYPSDLKLFEKLGLKPFETENQEQIFLGEYKLPHYEKAKIKIYVTCMPAQFYQFQVISESGIKYKIETGSGTLSEYWESVVKVATDMFEVSK